MALTAHPKESIPPWTGRSKLSLIWDVIGGPSQIAQKLKHTFHTLSCYFGNPVVRRRLERLRERGHLDHVPTLPQLLIGGRDQIIISAADETRELYAQQGIPWIFHNLRRFIADPSTMMDPVGFLCHRDSIIHHVFQTFHRHPVYDLVLLDAHEDGLPQIVEQLAQLKAGTHIQQRALKSLIEHAGYHAQLERQIPQFADNPLIAAKPLPLDLSDDPYLMIAMDQFKDVRGFTNYASRLPVGAWDLVKAVFQLFVGKAPARVQVECCDPEIVARYLGA